MIFLSSDGELEVNVSSCLSCVASLKRMIWKLKLIPFVNLKTKIQHFWCLTVCPPDTLPWVLTILKVLA